MKKATKKAKRVGKREYLAGYVGERMVYGPDENLYFAGVPRPTFIERMTLAQANKKIKSLVSLDADRAIYRLVPVKVVKGKR